MDREKAAKFLAFVEPGGGFARLLTAMGEKYRRFGEIKGQFVLEQATSAEREALGGFLQKNFQHQQTIMVTAGQLRKALAQTPYGELTWEEILRSYFGDNLQTTKEARQQKAEAFEQFLESALEGFWETHGGRWLDNARHENEELNTYLRQQYEKNREGLKAVLGQAVNGINHLPALSEGPLAAAGGGMRLAVFAARYGGDPHAFDEGRAANHLLSAFLYQHFGQEKTRGAEVKNELFYRAGILRDDLLNYTMTFGFGGMMKNNLPHPGMAGYLKNRDPLLLTLQTIAGLQAVDYFGTEVFIVENSGVFGELVENVKNAACPPALLCTGGQLKLASLAFLDLAEKSAEKLYYSGDFDPEGLQIAQKLKIRYGDKLILWHYEAADYEKALSQVVLSEERLAKLARLSDPKLAGIGSLIKETRLAGYQEYLLDEYLKDI